MERIRASGLGKRVHMRANDRRSLSLAHTTTLQDINANC